ncbi:unnamed protein product [Phytophthora fragariaefolia]|uniref:Unnamed protein product n=1 Tax=Phytophthora fragariaefolia TaxID=1490495 RepID=A0A9W6UCP3_9STRA|nr:unnamed protein product [Phytophthora fragariaefolia]
MFRPQNQSRPTLSPSLSPPSSPASAVARRTEPERTSDSDDVSASGADDVSASGADDVSASGADDNEVVASKEKDADSDYAPPKGKAKAKGKISKWSNRDEKRLISAWHEVVTLLAKNGYAGSFASRNEGLRLNAMIHQRYVEIGDAKSARTNQSTGAKKHAIMMAFRSLRAVLRVLASLTERPNWFGMTPDERVELQKMHGHHQEHACYIEKETYQQLAEIDRAQRTISTPTPNARRPPLTLAHLLQQTTDDDDDPRKTSSKKSGKTKYTGGPPQGYVVAEGSSDGSSGDGVSDDAASTRNGRSENLSRGANSQSLVTPRRPRSPVKDLARRSSRDLGRADDLATVDGSSPHKRRRTGFSDAKWVTRLLNAQTQRFEALLAEFQEERRQERQHNMEIIVEALKLRSASPQKSDQPSQFVEALVEKQRQHVLGLFKQMQAERSREREQARMLLRELGAPRLVSSQDQEHKDGAHVEPHFQLFGPIASEIFGDESARVETSHPLESEQSVPTPPEPPRAAQAPRRTRRTVTIMPVSTAATRVNAAWGNDELSLLAQAWGEVVDEPKDRLVLSSAERSALHARFCALSDSSRRSLSSVARQHHRLCMSYHLIVDTNRRSLRAGTPGWFDLPAAEQHELRRAHSKKEKGVTVVNAELFAQLDRACRGDNTAPKPPTKKHKAKGSGDATAKQSGAHSHHMKKTKSAVTEPEEEVDEGNDNPRIAWSAQDWTLFVDAWQEAADEFLELGNEPDEKVKLPNWLIRQKFVARGGAEDTTVGSITAKKRCIIHSYNFIQQCVAGLEALDGSDWFDLTFNERFRLQRKLVSPKSSQRVGCELDRETFHKIGIIMEKENLMGTVTGRKRKRKHKQVRQSSVSSEASSDESLPRSPSLSPSRDNDEVSDPEESRPITRHPHSPRYEGDGSQVDEQVVEALLEAQNARFEQLMHDLREERLEERKQNQAMLLEILHERSPAEDSNQNVSYLESLVGKQQEQLMDLFAQMHKEREQEREDFHALLRQLCSRPRSSPLVQRQQAMSNVTSWTETEINILVQAWSEVEAKYPSLRCPRGAGTLHAKLFSVFSKRCKFFRSSSAVNRTKNRLRNFTLFVRKYNEDRQKDGGRKWFDLSVDEREQRRKMLPAKIRGMTSSVSKKAFATLLTMDRAQRWLGGNASADNENGNTNTTLNTSVVASLPPSPLSTAMLKDQETSGEGISSLKELSSPSSEQQMNEVEDRLSADDYNSGSCSPLSVFDGDDLPTSKSSPPKLQVSSTKSQKEIKKAKGSQRQLKHRDCNVLLENMMKLQNKKIRRTVSKLRAEIEYEIQRSSGMLRSIISNHSEEAVDSDDAAFVRKVLDVQLEQVQDYFDQFDEERTNEEIDVLVQAWSEVEAKYPLMRCPPGSGSLQAKVYALFAKRASFSRSSIACEHTKQQIRNFVLFIVRYDQDRRKDGGRFWYEPSANERERHRGLVPRRARGLTTALSRHAFAKLLKMERVKRWLSGVTTADPSAEYYARSNSSFLSPQSRLSKSRPTTQLEERSSSAFDASLPTFSPLSGANTLSAQNDAKRVEEQLQIPERQRSDCTRNLQSEAVSKDLPMPKSKGLPGKPPPTQGTKKTKTDLEVRSKLKHRDCNILLETLTELQNTKVRRAVCKLRAEVDGEIQRSSNMLQSIVRDHFKDPKSCGDVVFVTKVLDMQKQQVRERFDRFEKRRAQDEAECRALLGQRFA